MRWAQVYQRTNNYRQDLGMYSNRQRSAYRAEADYNATPHQDTVHQALAPKTYRKKTCGMFNAAYHMHQLQILNCECETNLQFAFKSEKHQGVCWNETLK